MAVDVSHLSDEAFWDIMDITQAPVSASHSNSRAVWPESRNLTDAQFRAICETGGVAGINLFTGFLGGSRLLWKPFAAMCCIGWTWEERSI